MHATVPAGLDRHAAYNKSRLFLVSVLALFTAGFAEGMRANVAADIQKAFFHPIDPAHAVEMIGAVLGVTFLGFAFTIAIGSPLLDKIGMAVMLPLAGLCFIIGSIVLILQGNLASGAGVYNVLWIGAVITGVEWGLVETVINP